MKRLIAISLLSLALAGSAFAQEKPTGPFGFTKGMTREQIIRLVGEKAVMTDMAAEIPPDVLHITTAPIPSRLFRGYVLVISPTQGLLKVTAIGTLVATGDAGHELMARYNAVVASLSSKYGAYHKSNFCTGDECGDPQLFLTTLSDNHRKIATFWVLGDKGYPNGLEGIMVEPNGDDTNTGYVTVKYEFEGFNHYDCLKTAANHPSISCK